VLGLRDKQWFGWIYVLVPYMFRGGIDTHFALASLKPMHSRVARLEVCTNALGKQP